MTQGLRSIINHLNNFTDDSKSVDNDDSSDWKFVNNAYLINILEIMQKSYRPVQNKSFAFISS